MRSRASVRPGGVHRASALARKPAQGKSSCIAEWCFRLCWCSCFCFAYSYPAHYVD
ncbi:hypothetical protein JCM10003_2703 [Bacteroides pyogenes JCM 10003]|nr:hypothetical protein JCM10003_2703 [Bacteroides pyogenes JCM 10003]